MSCLTVVGSKLWFEFLIYSLIQRQVRQDLQQYQRTIKGNKGDTTRPTAAVVLESFVSFTQVSLDLDGVEVCQVHSWQAHHDLICEALGLDKSWYTGAAIPKNHLTGPGSP